MGLLKVYTGAAFVTAVGKVFDGSVWKNQQKFWNGTAWIDLFASGGTVPLVSDIEIKTTVTIGIGAAAIHFNYPTGGVGTEDARVLTKRNAATFTDMGNDDASPPVDHTGEWTTDTITDSEWEVAWISTTSGGPWTTAYAAIGVYTLLSVLGETNVFMWRMHRTAGKGYTPGTSTITAVFRIREVADVSNFDDFEVICTSIQT